MFIRILVKILLFCLKQKKVLCTEGRASQALSVARRPNSLVSRERQRVPKGCESTRESQIFPQKISSIRFVLRIPSGLPDGRDYANARADRL